MVENKGVIKMVENVGQLAIEQAKANGGKLEVVSKVTVNNRHDLSIAYTPGVASVSSAIAENADLAYTLTTKKNTVAVVSDGTAVLGLGDIGPAAAMPVMEEKLRSLNDLRMLMQCRLFWIQKIQKRLFV